jgi:hypothetical protein
MENKQVIQIYLSKKFRSFVLFFFAAATAVKPGNVGRDFKTTNK